mmetsp:Transcript_36457/g.66989  ORF Transcript_36457/g.66989 Transcript_36457/m.66989 type:complete len:204 (-) Transcript_36457:38-649(-)
MVVLAFHRATRHSLLQYHRLVYTPNQKHNPVYHSTPMKVQPLHPLECNEQWRLPTSYAVMPPVKPTRSKRVGHSLIRIRHHWWRLLRHPKTWIQRQTRAFLMILEAVPRRPRISITIGTHISPSDVILRMVLGLDAGMVHWTGRWHPWHHHHHWLIPRKEESRPTTMIPASQFMDSWDPFIPCCMKKLGMEKKRRINSNDPLS